MTTPNPTLAHGETYQNRRGDFRGPMRECAGYFLDQYGFQYTPDGVAVGHGHRSTATIDLSTAGTTEGWREADGFDFVCQQEADERDDEVELYREPKP